MHTCVCVQNVQHITSACLLDIDYFLFSFDRNETPPCDEVLDVATLLRNHITSNVLLAKTVVFIIRRSKPWKSFMREVMQHRLDDSMDFEVYYFHFKSFCNRCHTVYCNKPVSL